MNNLKHQFFRHPKPPPLQPPTTTTTTSAARSTKSCNAVINRLSAAGAHCDVLLSYSSMLKTNTHPDAYTFPSLLKACASLYLYSHGLSFHQQIIMNGFSSDAYVASSLISFYAQFGYSGEAHKVFDTMTERNVVPWTALIGCYSRPGNVKTAFLIYNQMRNEGVQPSSVTFLGLLNGISEFSLIECLHSCVIQYGFESDVPLGNSLLNVYGKCGRVEDAMKLFESMERRDTISWNSMISAYALTGDTAEILQLLCKMRVQGIEPDELTFGSWVSAAAREGNFWTGKLVHSHIVTSGFEVGAHIQTSLMVMYLKFGNVDDAFRIFERTVNKDVIIWTAMISGLVHNECADKALRVFRCMLDSRVSPSFATVACVIAACAQLGSLNLGTSIHGYFLRQQMLIDIPTQNSLITMYAKCGRLEQSLTVFDMMDKRDVVSWNAVVAGYAQNGQLYRALSLFSEMRSTLQRPDSITLVSLLQACASTGAFQLGKWIHNFVIRSELGSCILIDTALVDMYCKSGDLVSARRCFDRMSQHDLVSWSTIIAGYGSHGKGEMALEMFSKCLHSGLKPNHVIFLSVLCACSHNGLINEGLRLFRSMTQDFGIKPKLEHCACIVDLFSRAGKVDDAFDFYKRMFPEPAVDVLGILLDACRSTRNIELSDVIAKEISSLNPADASNYVQLVQGLASMARWDNVSEAWIQMRSHGMRKIPGWSTVELHGTFATFYAGHRSHSKYEDIVLALKSLSKEIMNLHVNFEPHSINIDDIMFFSDLTMGGKGFYCY